MEEEDLQQPLTEEVQQTDLEQDFANRELGFTPDYEAVQEQARTEFEENTALQEQMLAAQAEEEKDQGFLPDNPLELAKETGKAVYGGVTDAVESVGSTIDLLGDTIKTVSHKMQGV